MKKQQGRVAIVTGGARGIGAATCHRLAEDGALVVALDLDEAAATRVARDLPHGGAGMACDITDQGQVSAAVADVHRHFGSIDILVNNAGALHNVPFLEMKAAQWRAIIETNLTGTFNVTQAVARHMRDAGYGRITMVSSLAALGNSGQANYAASKAGLSGLAKTVALELGSYGVTCNVVAPGFVDTDMSRRAVADKGLSWDEFEALTAERVAVRRLGQPGDIAATIALLSLPESEFVTGQVLYATGGPVV
jgi:3-oxoacyl-[acyl-carrier protein] reductase